MTASRGSASNGAGGGAGGVSAGVAGDGRIATRGDEGHVWTANGRRALDFAAGPWGTWWGHAHPDWSDAIARAALDLGSVGGGLVPRGAQALLEEFCRQAASHHRLEHDWVAGRLTRSPGRALPSIPEGRSLVAFGAATPEWRQARRLPATEAGLQELVASTPAGRTPLVSVEPFDLDDELREPGYEFWVRLTDWLFDRGGSLVMDERRVGGFAGGSPLNYDTSLLRPDWLLTTLDAGAGSLSVGLASEGGMWDAESDATCTVDSAADFVPMGLFLGESGMSSVTVMAVASALSLVERERLLDNAQAMGEYLAHQVGELAFDAISRDHVASVRAQGVLVALTLRPDSWAGGASALASACRERGLLVETTGAHGIVLAPPLSVARGHVRAAVDLLRSILASGLRAGAGAAR